MIASIILTITSLGRNATACARKHNIVRKPGVGALLVGLARPNVGRLVMDHLNDINDAQIRHVAQRAARGTGRGRNRQEADDEEAGIPPRIRLR